MLTFTDRDARPAAVPAPPAPSPEVRRITAELAEVVRAQEVETDPTKRGKLRRKREDLEKQLQDVIEAEAILRRDAATAAWEQQAAADRAARCAPHGGEEKVRAELAEEDRLITVCEARSDALLAEANADIKAWVDSFTPAQLEGTAYLSPYGAMGGERWYGSLWWESGPGLIMRAKRDSIEAETYRHRTRANELRWLLR
jgi:hypothetical protein